MLRAAAFTLQGEMWPQSAPRLQGPPDQQAMHSTPPHQVARKANPFLMHCAQETVALSLIWGLDTVVSLDPSIHPPTTDQINQVEWTSKQTLSRAICDSFLSERFSSYVTREIQTERHRLEEPFFETPKLYSIGIIMAFIALITLSCQ